MPPRPLTALAAGAAALAWPAGLSPRDPPPRTEAFAARLREFQTVWIATPEEAKQYTFEINPNPDWLVRWDGARGIGMLENWGETRRWSWYAGQASNGVANEVGQAPPTFYGAAVDAEVAAAWAEVRAGLPNTTFTDVTAQEHALDLQAAGYHDQVFRLDLPFTWDDPYEIYLGLDEAGNPTSLEVREAVPNAPWLYAAGLDVAWNVPLRDDFDNREGVFGWEVGGPRWHVTGATTHDLVLDTAASLLDPPPPIERGRADYRVHAWDAPCTAAGTTTRQVRFVYRLDPASYSYDRALAAMAANCPMVLRTVPESLLQVSSPTKARFDATLTVKSGAGAVLVQTTAAAAATPGVQVNAWTIYDRSVPLPPSNAPDPGLTFELAGTLSLTCKGPGPATNRVAAAEGGSELLWPGCYPDFGAIPSR